MIVPKHYDHSLYQKIPERIIGKYSVIRGVLPKGTWIRCYSPVGIFYMDYPSSNYPVVKLVELGPEGGVAGVWMSDSPMEQDGLSIPVVMAKGHVLVLGLGLGLYPHILLKRNKTVTKVTIVEAEQDVIKLVYPHISSSKTEVVCSSAEVFLACNKTKFDFIYIDVWPDIVTSIREADKWLSLCRPHLAEDGLVRCWLQELYDRVKFRLPKEPLKEHGPPAVYDPCLICGKKLRFDYAGLCMDCADRLEVSELCHQG